MSLIPEASSLYISRIPAYLSPLCPFSTPYHGKAFSAFRSSAFTKHSTPLRCLFLLNTSMIYLETIIQMLLYKEYKCSCCFSQNEILNAPSSEFIFSPFLSSYFTQCDIIPKLIKTLIYRELCRVKNITGSEGLFSLPVSSLKSFLDYSFPGFSIVGAFLRCLNLEKHTFQTKKVFEVKLLHYCLLC